MALPPDSNDIFRDDLSRQLKVGHSLFLKNARLLQTRAYFVAALVALLLVVGAALWVCQDAGAILDWLMRGSWLVNHAVFAALVIVMIVVSASPWLRVWCFESFFAFFGCIGSNLFFLLGLNRSFLRRGSLDRLLKLK